MNDIMDMKISGSSAMPGGEYRLVSISGSGKVQGSLRCESLRCSGSARVQGDVDCAGEIRCSGSSRSGFRGGRSGRGRSGFRGGCSGNGAAYFFYFYLIGLTVDSNVKFFHSYSHAS